ncbi:MAG: lipoprotein insertase outer membrane protein LolB [Methylomonas sp.]
MISTLVCSLNACSFVSEKPIEGYQLAEKRHLQNQSSWNFQGRLAMVDEKESVSASISWRHQPQKDEIELVGPLAQGHIAILVTPGSVVVDDGDKRQEYAGTVDAIVAEQLGIDMPVNALKFWVLGVNDPRQSVVEQEGGFFQGGWLVRYREMQRVNAEWLPKKMTAEKDKTRIKLIVDQWNLS